MRRSLRDLVEMHITGTGNGYEIDDIMSNGKYSPDLINEIGDLADRYRSVEYPVGISNPASFKELREIAARYDQQLSSE